MRVPLAVAVGLSLAVIPVIGFVSTFKNLRCPACGGNVGFQVSANTSAFADAASKNCRHCGQKIFRDVPRGSGRRMIITIVAGAFAISLIASLVTALAR